MKKKVLFFSHQSQMYGATVSLFLLLEYIVKNRRDYYDIKVITFGNGDFIEKIKNLGIDCVVLPTKHLNRNHKVYFMLSIFFKLFIEIIINSILIAKEIFKFNPDIIYVNTISRALPVIIGKLFRKPIIVHVREGTSFLKSNLIFRKFSNFLILKNANYFICVSKYVEKLVRKFVNSKKVKTIYNGIDCSSFVSSEREFWRNQYRLTYGIDKNSKVILFVGSISYRKGIDIFLRAAEKLLKTLKKDIYFVIVGGVHNPTMAKLINKYKSFKRIIFVGFQKEIKPYYYMADIFIMPSRDEPFARVNLEACCSKLAIIASDSGGNLELFENGKNALIFKSNNVDDLVEKIKLLLDNESLSKQLAQNAYIKVIKNFSLKKCNSDICETIEKCLVRLKHNK